MKKLLSVLILGFGILFGVVFVGGVETNAYTPADFGFEISKWGFTIDENRWVPYSNCTNSNEMIVTNGEYVLGDALAQTIIVEMLMRGVNDNGTLNNIYAYIYKVITIPINKFINGSVLTTVQLNSSQFINSYTPRNKASQISGSLQVGYGDGKFNVAARVNFSFNELTISSNTGSNFYSTLYKYEKLLGAPSEYLKNRIDDNVGMFIFTSNTEPIITVNHEVEYNVFYVNDWSPRSVSFTNVLGKETKNHNFSTYYSHTSTTHTHLCPCGKAGSYTEGHNLYAAIRYMANSNTGIGTYGIKLPTIDGTSHDIKCYKCPYTYTQTHTWQCIDKAKGIYVCNVCGAEKTGPVAL